MVATSDSLILGYWWQSRAALSIALIPPHLARSSGLTNAATNRGNLSFYFILEIPTLLVQSEKGIILYCKSINFFISQYVPIYFVLFSCNLLNN